MFNSYEGFKENFDFNAFNNFRAISTKQVFCIDGADLTKLTIEKFVKIKKKIFATSTSRFGTVRLWENGDVTFIDKMRNI